MGNKDMENARQRWRRQALARRDDLAPADRIALIPVGSFKTADRRPAFRITDAAAVIAASLAAAKVTFKSGAAELPLAPAAEAAVVWMLLKDHQPFAGALK